MKYNVNGVNINYLLYGNSKGKTIVFLHGWGQNIEMMRLLSDHFADKFNILVLDLPGHGKSTIPTYAWSVYDFTDSIHDLLRNLNIEKPIIVGHSFGGKICIAYSGKYETEKIVLLASPFKKEIEKMSLKIKIFKSLIKIPGFKKIGNYMKKHMGSTDYRNANGIMRDILVKTVNQDVIDDAKKIKSPTLIIWGTEDKAVSIERAFELEKLINDSAVIKFEGATHYAYIERISEVVTILKNFFK